MNADARGLVDLETLRTEVRRLARTIGLQDKAVEAYPRGDGTPFVAIDDAYHFIIAERGVEHERRTTASVDELLYWIFDAITFTAANDYELAHRRPGEDFRRQMFAKQEELLASLSESWGRRKADAHRLILRDHPFADGADEKGRPRPSGAALS